MSKSKIVKLGNYIEEVDIRNRNNCFNFSNVKGISTSKIFIKTKADLNGVDLSLYKIVPLNHFAYVEDTSRRGDKIALAFADKEECIVSNIYTVFKVKENSGLIPRYLMMIFNRKEFDRYARFHSWGSAREVFDWNEMCSIELELPPIDMQRKYVSIFESLVANLQAYENGLSDLKLVCDGYFDGLKKRVNPSTLGDFITRVDIRNSDNFCKKVMGVSTSKEFREPTSKVNKNELSNYKICKPRQISFVQTTHNEKVFCNAMNRFNENVVVTSVNEVFECDETRLLPEFLTMYFNRKEFDRYARFHSWGSAREVFTWSDLVAVKMPIPSIEEQRSIVAILNTLIARREYLSQLKNIVSNICPVLVRGSILEAKGGDSNAN